MVRLTYKRFVVRMIADDAGNAGNGGVLLDGKSVRKIQREIVRWGYHYNQGMRALNAIKCQLEHGRIDYEWIRSVVIDGAAVLMRIGGILADMPRLDAVTELCVGLSGPVLGRICRTRDYLSNADETLASSDALMAKGLGISAEALEYAMESEAAQAQAPEGDEDWIGGTLDEDRSDDTESDW